MTPPVIPHPRCSLDVIFVFQRIFCSAVHQMLPWRLKSREIPGTDGGNTSSGWGNNRLGFREDEDPIRCQSNQTRLPRRRQSVVMESETSQRTLSKAADKLRRSLYSPKKTE
ncbi:hypothetical protein TNCV_2791301 [Trichonephila clavipes]|nr:hypothetical protein TNCV_2791301 [Trichonephila clavipes]